VRRQVDCQKGSNDCGVFLQSRSKKIYEALKARIDMEHQEPVNEELEELILSGNNYCLAINGHSQLEDWSRTVHPFFSIS